MSGEETVEAAAPQDAGKSEGSVSSPGEKKSVLIIGGKSYQTESFGRSAIVDFRKHYIKVRPDPIEVIRSHLDSLTTDQQKVLLQEAYRDLKYGDQVPEQDLVRWIETWEGAHFTLYYILRRYNDVTFEQAGDLLETFVKESQSKSLDEWLVKASEYMDVDLAETVEGSDEEGS